jgi:predicted MFS family arabinose efflux permease
VRALLVTAGCHLVAALWVRLRLPAFDVLTASPGAVASKAASAVPGARAGSATGAVAASATGSAVRQSWTVTGRLLRNRDVRALLLVQWLPPAFVVAAEALIVPLVSARGFASGAAGLLLAAVPLGMLVGSLVMGRLVRPAVRERLVGPVLVAVGVPVMLLAVPVQLPVMAGLLFVIGAGFSYSLGVQRPFLEAVDPSLRGQAFAVLTTGLMTLQGLGPVVIGAVAEGVSIGAAMIVAGAGPVLIGLAWWYSRGRHGPFVPASAVGLG